jgi:hypothetical protein
MLLVAGTRSKTCGRPSKGSAKAELAQGEDAAPVGSWSSQEKLDEVVAAIDSRQVELLRDRFHYRVDLAPSDIRKWPPSVLAKKAEAEIPLKNSSQRRAS